MSYCGQCGQEMRAGARFCEHCGAPAPEAAPTTRRGGPRRAMLWVGLACVAVAAVSAAAAATIGTKGDDRNAGGGPDGRREAPTDVYWGGAYGDSIGKLTPGRRPAPRFVDDETVSGLATDRRRVYWGCNCAPGRIGRARLDSAGSQKEPDLVSVPGEAPIEDIDEAAGYVYWLTESDGVPVVGRSRSDGSETDPTFLSLPDPGDLETVNSIAVHGQHLYWDAGSAIGRAALDGSSVDEDFVPSATAADLAVNSRYLFWVDDEGVSRADLSGSGATDVVSASDLEALAVDERHLYWARGSSTSEGGGLIARARLDGSRSRRLAAGPAVGRQGSMSIAVAPHRGR